MDWPIWIAAIALWMLVLLKAERWIERATGRKGSWGTKPIEMGAHLLITLIGTGGAALGSHLLWPDNLVARAVTVVIGAGLSGLIAQALVGRKSNPH